MKFLTAILLIYIVLNYPSGICLAQSREVVYWQFEKGNPLKKKDKRYSIIQRAGFQLILDDGKISLDLEDIRVFPKIFRHDRDRIGTMTGDLQVVLDRKEIIRQIAAQYDTMKFNEYTSGIANTYDLFLRSVGGKWTPDDSVYLVPSYYGSMHVNIPEVFKSKITDHCKPLKETAVSRRNWRKIRKKQTVYIKKLRNIHHAHYREQKKFVRFLKGKNPVRIPGDRTWKIIFPLDTNEDEILPGFIISSGQKTLGTLTFIRLKGLSIIDLPVPELNPCKQINRFTYFKRMNGFGFLKYPVEEFRPQTKRKRQEKFVLYFPRNGSTADLEKMNRIIRFLNDSSYTVLRAKVFAYASIEGPEANNIRLQKERAGVMLDALQLSNDEDIIVDTIATSENWELFYNQIRDSPFDSLLEVDRDSIKKYLENELFLSQLEPMLRRQRFSVLFLLIAEKLDEKDKVKVAYGQYTREINRINSQFYNGLRVPDLQRAVAIRQYLESSMINRTIPGEDVCVRLDRLNDYAHKVATFYAIAPGFLEGKKPACHPMEYVLVNAHLHLVRKLKQFSRDRNKLFFFQRQAVDLQMFTYDRILSGDISPDFFCLLQYPDEYPFYPMIINRIDFENNYFHSMLYNTPCYMESSIKNARHNPEIYYGPAQITTRSSKYYYFLKKRLIYNDREIRDLVIRSDDLFEFDLYDFLRISLDNWIVKENKYFDPDIDYRKMKVWLGKLQAANKLICESEMNKLFVMLHQKTAGMSRHGHKYLKDAGASLSYLATFYAARISVIPPGEAMDISQILLSYNGYFYHNEAVKAASYFLLQYIRRYPEQQELVNFYKSLNKDS